MGQRTAIIVQMVDEKQKKDTRVFYCHWGNGRILPSKLMSAIIFTLSGDPHEHGWLDEIRPQGTSDITKCYNAKDIELMSRLDFAKPELVGHIIKGADNNNGGIFLRIVTQNDPGHPFASIEYAYMLGDEEGGDYKRFCSEDEWFQRAGKHYIDDNFKTLYHKTLAYFDAKEHKSEDEKQ